MFICFFYLFNEIKERLLVLLLSKVIKELLKNWSNRNGNVFKINKKDVLISMEKITLPLKRDYGKSLVVKLEDQSETNSFKIKTLGKSKKILNNEMITKQFKQVYTHFKKSTIIV